MTDLHGFSPFCTTESAASHEAGHLLMSWLLGRDVIHCSLREVGGDTQTAGGELETPHQRLLASLSGMVMEENVPVLKELLEHLDNPAFFHRDTDSFAAAIGAEMICREGQQEFLLGLINVIQRFKSRYMKAYNAARIILMEHGQITAEKCHVLFNEWDRDYILEKRPKSDVVYREIAGEFGWELPQNCFIGWNLEPIQISKEEDRQ